MIYQIVHPFSLAISGETMKDAIKNYAKYNYDNTINQLIVTDKINHMRANIDYYKENDKNKVKIGMKPVYWNGVGFDNNGRFRVPFREFPYAPTVDLLNNSPTIPNRAMFYNAQPQPIVTTPPVFVAPQPRMLVAPQPRMVVAPPARVVSPVQAFLYPQDNFMPIGSSDSVISGKTNHYLNVPGSFGVGFVNPAV